MYEFECPRIHCIHYTLLRLFQKLRKKKLQNIRWTRSHLDSCIHEPAPYRCATSCFLRLYKSTVLFLVTMRQFLTTTARYHNPMQWCKQLHTRREKVSSKAYGMCAMVWVLHPSLWPWYRWISKYFQAFRNKCLDIFFNV